MLKRLTILCLSALLLTSMLGCQPKTRYRALCLLFDGVPPPPGMVPCDGRKPGGTASNGSSNDNDNEKETAPAYMSHGPYAARLCEGCHQRQTNRLLMAKEDLCFNCHDLSLKKRVIHGPVASGSCLECHDPHGSGNKFLLIAKSQDFCLHCHENKDILKTAAHQNMETGCTTCHNAHASDNDFLLIASAAEGYKAKRQTPPPTRAGQPLKERASQPPLKERASQPPLKERASQPPLKERASSGNKQGPPATSSDLTPEKGGNKYPTSSGAPPTAPGADLKNNVISKRTPTTKSTERKIDLVEAKREH